MLGGSTGSGKSTITNTLAGADVSPAGVLRPTTRAPVLICNPLDESWFASADVLPDLPRLTGDTETTATGQVLRIRAVDTVRPGLALLDAPDIDSVENANRELATQLLASADLWLFVTTAVRYADAVPWEFLNRARERGTELSIIINRVPSGAGDEIVPHLAEMLTDGGLVDVTIYPIEQQAELVGGRLDEASIAPLRARLTALADNSEERAAVIRATLDGALDSIPARLATVEQAAVTQDRAADEMRLAMERIYADARQTIAADVTSGKMLRGEVLDRWQELIGTGELMRAVQSRIGWLRDRIGAAITGRMASTTEVQGEINSTLEQLLIDHADAAALRVAITWRQLPGGEQMLAADRSLERASDDFNQAVGPEIRAWQDDILGLVKARGAGKRNTARVLAFGVNGVGVALMIVLFAQTGGITGGEVAVASGTAGVSQTLLNALFGEQAVRELASDAKKMLLERVGGLIGIDANRFRTRLWSTVSPAEATAALAVAREQFEAAR
ncbi:MAG: energy-coupling factor transporter ATP-binding protein EcfA2 [Acidimicrobiales bacterium]